jgi:hypothetical protein
MAPLAHRQEDLIADPLLPVANDLEGDWVDDVRANSESYGRFELVYDEATGLYDLRETAPAHVAADQAPKSAPEAAHEHPPVLHAKMIADEAPAEDLDLTGWASLSGPTGPNTFHAPLQWAVRLAAAPRLSPVTALTDTCCGSVWPMSTGTPSRAAL